ncbi:MAG: hypothetical protein ACYDGN_13490 [Acidimicrobiales bacterium]
MTDRRRVLIDWDHEATGIWRIAGQGGAVGRTESPSLLSPELLAALKSWNDHAAQAGTSGPAQMEVRLLGRELAGRVQAELGDDWDVLYQTGGAWAWSWVSAPWR